MISGCIIARNPLDQRGEGIVFYSHLPDYVTEAQDRGSCDQF